jgi:integrase
MNKFTDTFIKRLRPQIKRYEIFEGGGFGLFVYPAGTKTWVYRYKIYNKKDYVILGHYPEITLAEARKKFIELKEKKRSGQNPKDTLLPVKNNHVKNLVLDWYANYIEKHRKQPLQIKQQIDADIIPLFGDMQLDKIQTRDISKGLDSIVKRGSPIHANKVLSTLKQAFNYAVSRGELDINPAVNIRARDIGGIEKPRDRNLSLDEIKALWIFLDSTAHHLSLQTKNAIKIILLTGIRSGELRLATWDEFDFEQSLWSIPAAHTKTGLVMKVHLTEQVKTFLRQLKETEVSNFVLPGLNGTTPLTDKALSRAINRIQERVGIPHWTAHDLRRTFATQLGEALHVDPVVIEKCLGHKMPKIMATYNKNEMLPQRKEALTRWSEYLDNLLQDNVVPILLSKCS